MQILLAEDHEDSRELLLEIIKQKIPGCEVIAVEDGLEAWLWLSNHTPDLVIMDMLMPRMTGMELFRTMRQDERLKHIPVVALTGIHLPFGEGFCTVLTKPIPLDILVNEIVRCVRDKPN